MKKRVFSLLLAFVLIAALLPQPVSAAREEITVYNWGQYISDGSDDSLDVIAAFEEATGIHVNYLTFDSNESMYTKLKTGGASYDVIIPSDYMIAKLIEEDMLEPLDFANIPNYEYIDEAFRNQAYDPENLYSVPYTWGTVGLIYNRNYVSDEDAESWSCLWNSKYAGKLLMFDNPRDAFGIALKKLGYSMNTTNESEWEAAYQELLKQKPLLQQYVMDQVYDKMINEEGYIAPYYSGDGIIMMDPDEGNTDIKYFVPKEGTNRFVDAVCVTTASAHKTEAEKYINFLCRTEVAKANAEAIGYSTPHTEARKLLDPEVGENPIFYPSEDILNNTEVFDTLPDNINELQDSLWIKLKSN